MKRNRDIIKEYIQSKGVSMASIAEALGYSKAGLYNTIRYLSGDDLERLKADVDEYIETGKCGMRFKSKRDKFRKRGRRTERRNMTKADLEALHKRAIEKKTYLALNQLEDRRRRFEQ